MYFFSPQTQSYGPGEAAGGVYKAVPAASAVISSFSRPHQTEQPQSGFEKRKKKTLHLARHIFLVQPEYKPPSPQRENVDLLFCCNHHKSVSVLVDRHPRTLRCEVSPAGRKADVYSCSWRRWRDLGQRVLFLMLNKPSLTVNVFLTPFLWGRWSPPCRVLYQCRDTMNWHEQKCIYKKKKFRI